MLTRWEVEGQLRSLNPMQQHARRVHGARAGARRKASLLVALVLGTGMLGGVVLARLEPGAARSAATFDWDDSGPGTSPTSWVGSYHVRTAPVFQGRGGRAHSHGSRRF